MEENKIYCAHCGERIENDDYEEFDGEIWCDACLSENTVTCDRCGGRIIYEDAVQDDDITLCESCFDNYYHRCECCGRIIRDGDVYWHNDYPYCEHCIDSFTDEIAEYSYKPDPVFHGDGPRFFGVELEIDHGGKDDENARIFKEIANADGEYLYIKSDGSLDDGMELVTHPMDLDYHKNFCWKEVMTKAISLGYRSHQTSTCGLHIHVNRDGFGDSREEQDEVISRILYFVEHHWNELLRFSRRSEYSMNRWAARYGYEKSGRDILEKAQKGGQGRYAAVNLMNWATIEFRLFRGTLKYNTLIAAIELVNEICDLAVNLTDEGIAKMSWSEFVETIEAPELIQYLKERKLYVNDTIENEEDM